MANTVHLEGMTKPELDRFSHCEAVIARGQKTFQETGAALLEIRDSRLYRLTFKTFEAYCVGKWGFARRQADRLIEAAGVVRNLSPIGLKPENEAQARELAKLPCTEQAGAWNKAVKLSGGKPTAKQVAAAVEEIKSEIISKAKEADLTFTGPVSITLPNVDPHAVIPGRANRAPGQVFHEENEVRTHGRLLAARWLNEIKQVGTDYGFARVSADALRACIDETVAAFKAAIKEGELKE